MITIMYTIKDNHDGQNQKLWKAVGTWFISMPGIGIIISLLTMIGIQAHANIQGVPLVGSEWVIPLIITPILSPILSLIPAVRYYKGKPIKKLMVVLIAIPIITIVIQLILSLSNFM